MGITGGFGMTIDLEHGTSRNWVIGRDGVKRWADSGLPFTHKSIGHWSGDEDGAEWVSDGVACAEKNAKFSSADWVAVDCQDCLTKKTTGKRGPHNGNA